MTHQTSAGQDLKNELKSLILQAANLQGLSCDDIPDQQPLFREGLGLDSIDLLEIVVRLEKRYGIKIQNDETGKKALTNVSNLTETVRAHLDRSQATGSAAL